MSGESLLLVEDDETLALALEIALSEEGYAVRWSKDLASARAACAAEAPRIIVLDLGLPDGDGLELCRERRALGDGAAILVLTARGTLQARVEGLEGGADDYLTKPFELAELMARLKALQRRLPRSGSLSSRAVIGALEVDFEARSATVCGREIALTDLELRLLRYLLERRGQIISREQLLVDVWGRSPGERTRTVDVYMSRLRRHIDAFGDGVERLSNVRNVGYRLA